MISATRQHIGKRFCLYFAGKLFFSNALLTGVYPEKVTAVALSPAKVLSQCGLTNY
jgi:hypothetical protein